MSSFAFILRNGLRLLVPLSVVLSVYLYLYPVFLTCAFPLPPATSSSSSSGNGAAAFLQTVKLHLPFSNSNTKASSPTAANNHASSPRVAPFRLLALGDPQLEGDTSIPNAYAKSSFPHLNGFFSHLISRTDDHPTFRSSAKQAFHDLVDFYFDDIPNTLESIRKRIDLFGNDFYLAHMYRTLNWWVVPTHVSVLGDLVGSQWIRDEEFEARAWRYWNRVFKGGERVPDENALWPAEEYDLAGYLGTGVYNETWQRRIINVAGNHDIGYAGDLNHERMERFERAFGKANYELRFELPPSALSPGGASTIRNETAAVREEQYHGQEDRLVPELRVVVLNDMNLDTPALSPELQDQTYNFINGIINTASAVEYKGHFTVVLTHVPLYKPEGVCVDAPFFTFHDHDGTLKEQNQLSADASKGFVEGIFGLSGDTMAPAGGQGRRGVILNGHDHEGCDTYHFINQTNGSSPEEREWEVKRWKEARQEGVVGMPALPGVREITVRSMMGGYGGNAGLLSAWFDEEQWEWKFEYSQCPLGAQYIWWTLHVVDLITVVVAVAYGLVLGIPRIGSSATTSTTTKGKEEVETQKVEESNDDSGLEQPIKA
ncbi:Protein TED1 [Cytospora mali]|uniref:Protein TED1 n=1 Tax=Cytospora mali TaxID=578113 RepID=A0A194W4F6_CYTMA|nr:Protein TED1 [Valsa mali]